MGALDGEYDLGVPSLDLLPEVRRAPERWRAIERRIAPRPFLHSEGFSTVVGPPHELSGELLARFRELVERFDRFYAGAIDAYYQQPALRGEFLLNDLFAAAVEVDRDTPIALPLSRFDIVLTDEGELRVIELNSPGVCTLHLRAASYMAVALERAGLHDDARRVDSLLGQQIESVRRFYEAQRPVAPRPDPRVGLLILPEYHRGSRVLWRDGFLRAGFRWVEGTIDDLEITDEELRLRGQPIDILWGDFLFHLGYQYVRYRETRWSSKVGDFSVAPEQTARVLEDPRALALFRARRVVNITPVKSYLAMPKSLLSWIHRPDRPVPDEDRAWLARHVARTYSALDREEGAITASEVIARREHYLLKPCQYGGGHGVLIGRDTDGAEWARRVEERWRDVGWVVQDFYLPRRSPRGEWLSFGLYNYGGRLGGVTIRTDQSLLISARRAAFIPVATTP